VIISNLPSNSVDGCITDPPWIKFFDPKLTIDERTLPVFKALFRILKPHSFLYIFCGLDDYAYYTGTTLPNPDNASETVRTSGELGKIGYQVSNTPVIWKKEKALSRRGVRPWEYDRDFEFIIVAAKGSPALTTSRRLSGVKTCDIVPPVKMIHPHEKPIDLIEDIITDCSYEGNLIIDPFAGSGVVGEACRKNKRGYILCERDKKFYDNICKRLGIK
jgi:DNA modification methylase